MRWRSDASLESAFHPFRTLALSKAHDMHRSESLPGDARWKPSR